MADTFVVFDQPSGNRAMVRVSEIIEVNEHKECTWIRTAVGVTISTSTFDDVLGIIQQALVHEAQPWKSP